MRTYKQNSEETATGDSPDGHSADRRTPSGQPSQHPATPSGQPLKLVEAARIQSRCSICHPGSPALGVLEYVVLNQGPPRSRIPKTPQGTHMSRRRLLSGVQRCLCYRIQVIHLKCCAHWIAYRPGYGNASHVTLSPWCGKVWHMASWEAGGCCADAGVRQASAHAVSLRALVVHKSCSSRAKDMHFEG